MFLEGTVGTDALDHIVDALELIAIGEDDGGDGGVAQAEGAMTALAIEVHILLQFLPFLFDDYSNLLFISIRPIFEILEILI